MKLSGRKAAKDRAARRAGITLAAACLFAQLPPLPAAAQTDADMPVPVATAAPPAPAYSVVQLDQMVAPIALYPDELLGQILMAATYPLEVVQADRWLQDPANAALRGDELTYALQSQPWDPSVKSLVAFPQILAMMDTNLDWTEQLGDAFLAQQPDLMDSVQRLRARARAAGTLASSPQQQVIGPDQAIEIAPADSGTVYVPVYDPRVAYGPWPYAEYPPDDFFWPGFVIGSFIAFAIVEPFWGWDHWDWRHHHLNVGGGGGFGHRDPGGPGHPIRPSPVRPVPWHHDPQHRGGVPYRDPATRDRYVRAPEPRAGGGAPGGGNFRGFPAGQGGTAPHTAPVPDRRGGHGEPPQAHAPAFAPNVPASPRGEPSHAVPPVAPVPVPRGEPPRTAPPIASAPTPRAEPPRYSPPPMQAPRQAPAPRVERPPVPIQRQAMPPQVQRPAPPAMESFGRGPQVHVQEQRGASSRMTSPAPAPAQSPARGHK